MNNKKTSWLAWALCAIVSVSALIGLVFVLNTSDAPHDAFSIANDVVISAVIIVFGLVGALILGRQSRNTIGWLVMAMTLSLALASLLQNYLVQIVSTPPTPTLSTLLYFWLSVWTWWLLIGPLLLLLLLFPTGRLLSPRWRWVIVALTGIFVVFLFFATFSKTLSDPTSGQGVPNPLGVIPESISFEQIATPLGIMLLITSCVLRGGRLRSLPARGAGGARATQVVFVGVCVLSICLYGRIVYFGK